MAKLTSMVLMIAGFIVLVVSLMFKQVLNTLPLISGKGYIIPIIRIMLIFGGVVSGNKKERPIEVPIYDKKGKEIVGYRRTK
jgi:hypothetical protein